MLVFPLFIISLGTVAVARQPDIDINRIRQVPQGHSHLAARSSHERRGSAPAPYQLRTNDYDDHSSGYSSPPMLQLHRPSTDPKSTEALKVHQPREDPRLFYQSDTYLKENNGQNINREVSFVYPGREAIRSLDKNNNMLMPLRVKERKFNIIDNDYKICIRCPHDKTLIARPNADKVLLQPPPLFLCSGHRAPRNVQFVPIYGPKFGSLLEQGYHMIFGRITHQNKTMHLCKMQVHVIGQNCPTPKYLLSHCTGPNCSFACRDPKLELYGKKSLICGNNMKWIGRIPVCKARLWCEPPPPPDHGRISCKGTATEIGPGLLEGSKCRLHCTKGWRSKPRSVTVCRRGVWTNKLVCQKTHLPKY